MRFCGPFHGNHSTNLDWCLVRCSEGPPTTIVPPQTGDLRLFREAQHKGSFRRVCAIYDDQEKVK